MAPPSRKTTLALVAAALVLSLLASEAAAQSRTSSSRSRSSSTSSRNRNTSTNNNNAATNKNHGGSRNPPAASCPGLTGVPGCSACTARRGRTPSRCTDCSGAAYEDLPVNGVCLCADGYGRPPFPAPPAVANAPAHKKGGKKKPAPRPPRGRQPCLLCPDGAVSSITPDRCVYCQPTFIAVNNECVCPEGWVEVNGVCEDQGGIAGVCDGLDGAEPAIIDGEEVCVCVNDYFNVNGGLAPTCTECPPDASNTGNANTGCTCDNASETWQPVSRERERKTGRGWLGRFFFFGRHPLFPFRPCSRPHAPPPSPHLATNHPKHPDSPPLDSPKASAWPCCRRRLAPEARWYVIALFFLKCACVRERDPASTPPPP
jgi:hypothetical protein